MDSSDHASINDGTGAEATAPAPVPISSSRQANSPPPFLSKTYDMVDDSSTDSIVSWSSTNNSFVVWNPPEFARDLLPKYFKHSNFSSFVRQLNTYGFRKIDPDRWEFANEGFLRGQKHLLKTIIRRKPAHGHGSQQPQQSHGQSQSVSACVEVGEFGLEEEVERLKRDKNVLMQELVRLRQQQQATDNQLQTMVKRLQGMEQRQQQMMSFLAKAMQNPGFFAQFVQQQNDSTRQITEANKKRRLKPEGVSENQSSDAPDGQIVKYQPPMSDAAKGMMKQMMKLDTSRFDSYNNNPDAYLIENGSSMSSANMSGNSSNRISGVRLQEVPPTSVVSTSSAMMEHGPAAAISEIQPSPIFASAEKVSQFPDMGALIGAQETPSISIPQSDVILSPDSQGPAMLPESIVEFPSEDFMESNASNDEGLVDPAYLADGIMPIEFENISQDFDVDAFLDSSLLDELLQSPVLENVESGAVNDEARGNDMQQKDSGRNRAQHMDQLTEQMGLLSSDNRKKQ